MTDSRFYTPVGPRPLHALIAAIDEPATISASDHAIEISDIAALSTATRNDIAYYGSSGKKADLLASNAAAIFITEKCANDVTASLKAATIICTDPAKAFSQAIMHLFPVSPAPDYSQFALHQGAYIHPSARIEDNVSIAPGTLIEADVAIGQGTRIGPNCTLHHGVKIGRHCTLSSNITVQYALLGDFLTLHAGVRIGQDGFGFLPTGGPATKIPQMGRVIMQDHVEIGANTTIDRGALNDTIIGEGTKIDNQVQIGHNCQIGRHCILCGGVALGGSTMIADNVIFAGRSMAAGHVNIGEGAVISANSLVTKHIDAGLRVGGSPAKQVAIWRREQASLARLGKSSKKDH